MGGEGANWERWEMQKINSGYEISLKFCDIIIYDMWGKASSTNTWQFVGLKVYNNIIVHINIINHNNSLYQK